MVINKILNNNVVMIIDDVSGLERVVMGRGIAFNKKLGDVIDETKIEKVFMLTNSDFKLKLIELVKEIPTKYFSVVEEIVNYTKKKINIEIDEIITITLVDHIHRCIKNLAGGVSLKNGLLWDIKKFYPKEFECGKKAIEIIMEQFNIDIPIDEAANIALHIVNAQINTDNFGDMYTITMIMQEIINIVKYTFRINFDEDSIDYYRFITHIKFFAKRLIENKSYEDTTDIEILDLIKSRYSNSYKCVKDIAEFIYGKYNYKLTNEEELYLTVHIERIVYKSES